MPVLPSSLGRARISSTIATKQPRCAVVGPTAPVEFRTNKANPTDASIRPHHFGIDELARHPRDEIPQLQRLTFTGRRFSNNDEAAVGGNDLQNRFPVSIPF